jgi:nucleotide-binding universal stress UspA family protein
MASTWEILGPAIAEERAQAERATREAGERLAGTGAVVTTEIREGDPAREILAAADDVTADLVAMGTKGLTGLDAFLLGSVARNVAKHARRPVVVSRGPVSGLRRVIVATDGSDHARHAVRFAAALPLPAGVEYTAVNVVRPYSPFPGFFPADEGEFVAAVKEVNEQHHAAAAAVLESAREELAAGGKPATVEVREGDPAHELLALAGATGADLIVAGARGVSRLEGLLVGSVADRLLKQAPCSVLLVH